MKKRKKKIYLASSITFLYLLILFVGLISKLLSYSSNLVNPVSIEDMLLAPINGVSLALPQILFVLIIGGFLAVLYETKTWQAFIQKISEKLRNQEIWLIPLLIGFFTILSACYGFSLETIIFYPLLITLMLSLGYDKLTAIGIIIFGSVAGKIGSIINPVDTFQAMEQISGLIKIDTFKLDIIGNFLCFSLFTISSYSMIKYAKKVKNKKQEESSHDYGVERRFDFGIDEKIKFTTQKKAILAISLLTIALMIFVKIPWQNMNITIFENINFIFSKPIGKWGFNELTCIYFIATILMGIVAKYDEKKVVNIITKGMSENADVVLLIAFYAGFLNLMYYSGISQYLSANAISDLDSISVHGFIFIEYMLTMGLTFLTSNTQMLTVTTIPRLAEYCITNNISIELMIITYITASGIIYLIAPTNVVLLSNLKFSNFDFKSWISFAAKITLSIIIYTLIFFTILGFIL